MLFLSLFNKRQLSGFDARKILYAGRMDAKFYGSNGSEKLRKARQLYGDISYMCPYP